MISTIPGSRSNCSRRRATSRAMSATSADSASVLDAVPVGGRVPVAVLRHISSREPAYARTRQVRRLSRSSTAVGLSAPRRRSRGLPSNRPGRSGRRDTVGIEPGQLEAHPLCSLDPSKTDVNKRMASESSPRREASWRSRRSNADRPSLRAPLQSARRQVGGTPSRRARQSRTVMSVCGLGELECLSVVRFNSMRAASPRWSRASPDEDRRDGRRHPQPPGRGRGRARRAQPLPMRPHHAGLATYAEIARAPLSPPGDCPARLQGPQRGRPRRASPSSEARQVERLRRAAAVGCSS